MVALLSKGRHAFMGFLAGILAAFSSQHQGVVVGALINGQRTDNPKESWPARWRECGIASASLLSRRHERRCTSIGHASSGAMAESASLGSAESIFYAPIQPVAFPPPDYPEQESLSSMTQIPSMMEFGANWPWVNPSLGTPAV